MSNKADLFFFNKFDCELKETHTASSMPIFHYHDAYEIFFIVEGARYMAFNGVRQAIRRGDIFIAQPFVPHRSMLHEEGYYKRYTLNFSNADLQDFFTEEEIAAVTNHLTTGVYHLTAEQTGEIQRFLERITSYHSRRDSLSRKMTVMEIFQTLDYINTLLQAQNTPGIVHEHVSDMPPTVSLAMNYAKEHYRNDINLDMVADYVHLSKSQFCRVFQNTTGTSFMQYLNSYRLTQAHMLISHSEKPLHTIAAETGFYSTEHMTRTFQKTYKISPSQWRRTYK